ncbi:MAG: sulfurtransferase-like selenium metabolism protein YedF, partial [Pseudomonadota bacterium]
RQGQTTAPSPAPRQASPKGAARKVLVLVAADRMGRGDDALGAALLGNFLKTLPEMGPELWRLVFVNSGVKCAVAGSPHLEALEACEKAKTSILVCGTCLTHFNLLDQKKIGETTNMLDIVTSMQLADSVISV